MHVSAFRRPALAPAVLVGLVLALLCCAAPLWAATVSVVVARGSEDMAGFEKRLLHEAFLEAAMADSQAMLPTELDARRAELLRQFLDPRVDAMVRGYSELERASVPGDESVAESGEGGQEMAQAGENVQASFEISLDDSTLRGLLTRLGLFETADGRLPYTLTVRGPALDALEQVRDLQTLSGLANTSGAPVELTLDGAASGLSGYLKADGFERTAQAEDASALWLELWGAYFTRNPAAAMPKGAFQLTVTGWATPEGPQQFSERIASLDPSIRLTRLVGVELGENGISGRWLVAGRNPQALQATLAQELLTRGLGYSFQEPGQEPEQENGVR